MKAFITAQLTEEGLKRVSEFAEIKLGGWGHTGKKLEPQELVQEAADCEMLIICYEEINEYVLENLPKLKFIACSRGGVENIDREAVKKHPEVTVTSSPGRNANAVAELSLCLMIDALRHVSRTHHFIMSRKWDQVPWDIGGANGFKTFDGYELSGKTVGIVGMGIIGQRLRHLLSGFDVRIIAYDPYLKSWPSDVEQAGLEQLFMESDVISLHCKVTKENRGMIGKDLFRLMKPTAVFINTARGALVNEDDLYNALKQRSFACAAIDAQVHEPMLHNSPLLELDNIILTPHIGGASRDIIAQQTRIMLEDIVSFCQTGKAIHVI